MAVRVEVSEEIQRQAEVVFKFFAEDHVRNHPRWDPHVELWLDSEGPIGLGTIIRRRNSRSGTPVEGTMEVVEYEPGRAMGMLTHDGPLEIRGRATFEPNGPEITRLTLTAEIPAMDDAMQGPMAEAVQGSLRTIKELIESET
ncbi:MAG: SRPBCC family protein [Actinobacteria bacterium]|nr:SRPBCC family protein [Actinomycetota bacterium]